MARYVAFLRAINVGGRVVKMERLRQLFEELGLRKVETFITSGNVIFEARSKSEATLKKRIETALKRALGYEVTTFLRSDSEVAEIAAYRPFKDSGGSAEGTTLFVALLANPPKREDAERLIRFHGEFNDFHVRGREAYWLCRTSMLDSGFSGARLEKALGMPATLRNMNTFRRLAAKYGSS